MLFLLFQCRTSEPLKREDNTIEPDLEKVTGVTQAVFDASRAKLDSLADTTSAQPEKVANGLTLNDIYNLAVEKTERMAIGQEKIIQAQAKKNQAYGSWVPSLSYRYSRFQSIPDHSRIDKKHREQQKIAAIALNNPSLWPEETSSGSSLPANLAPGSRLVVHVPILTGLNEYTAIQSGQGKIDMARFDFEHDAGQFYLELAQVYFRIIQLENELQSANEAIVLAQKTRNNLQYNVKIGKNTKADLQIALAELARNEAELKNTQELLSRSKKDLVYLSGLEENSILADQEILPEMDFDLANIDQLVLTRADVKAATMNLQLAKTELKTAWGGFLPDVYLDGYYSLPQKNVPRNKDILAIFSIQFPIFSGGVTRARIQESESRVRMAKLELSQIKRKAFGEIQQANDAWTSSKQAIVAYKKALQAAEVNYRLQVSYHNRRLSTVLELLNSLSLLSRAKIDYNRSVLQEKLNRVWLGVATRKLPQKKVVP